MHMSETPRLQAFNDYVMECDVNEAYEINRQFDMQVAGQRDDALMLAMDKAHASLAPNKPYSERVGYIVARDALRWLNYRYAFTLDTVDANWSDDEVTRAERVKTVEGNHDTSIAILQSGDSLN